MQKIDIELKPSRVYLCVMVGLLIGSVAIAVSLPIGWCVRIMLMIGVLVYGYWVLWTKILMKGDDPIKGIQLRMDGSCYLRFSGYTIEAAVQGDSTVTTIVCALRFKRLGMKKDSAVIFKDTIGQERYRQLLVWLKCFGGSVQKA